MNRLLAVLAIVLCLGVQAEGQQGGDAEWSWQTPEDFFENVPSAGAGKTAPAPAGGEMLPDEADAGEVVPVAPGGETNGLIWDWEEQAVEGAVAVPPVPAAPGGEEKAVNVSAYDELLRENLDLRQEADRAVRQKDELARENTRLQAEVKDLSARVQELAGLVQAPKEGQAPAADAARLAELQSAVTAANAENERLKTEVEELKLAVRAQEAAPAAAPGPGSDLFKQLQQENARLKEDLASLREEQQKARDVVQRTARSDDKYRAELDRAREVERDLKSRLAMAEAGEQKHRRVVEQLLKQIPDLEEQLVAAKGQVEKRDAVLTARDREFETLKLELARREHRLVESEKVSTVLEEARRDVAQVSRQQERDMYYNMGLMYTREGRFREAERAYLSALRMDPTDAESHYNLGILYDDELNDEDRAAMHYRRYLKLNPQGQDADTVRGWLMQIETKSR